MLHERGQAKDALPLLRALSTEWADGFASEVLNPNLGRAIGLENPSLSRVADRLTDPFHALEAIYYQYAFARRGNDKHVLAAIAIEALHRVSGDKPDAFFGSGHAEDLWDAFSSVCQEQGKRSMEQLNYGPVAGLAELAIDIFRETRGASLITYLLNEVEASSRLETFFDRFVDIRGVGPKLASLFLRDMAFLYNLEDRVHPSDRIFLQPIDKWLRAISPMLFTDLESDSPDWILAGKIAKHTRRAGISAVRFNMGASYFGSREVRIEEALPVRLPLALR